jgi:hypothetical protein
MILSLGGSYGSCFGAAVWHLRNGRLLRTLPNGGSACYGNLAAWAPQGNRVAICAGEATRAVIDLTDGREMLRIQKVSAITGMQFSADGSRLWVTTAKALSLWDLVIAREIAAFAPMNQDSGAFEGINAWVVDENRGYAVLASSVLFGASTALELFDVRRLSASMERLAAEACGRFLAPKQRVFTDAEIRADPLLSEIWAANDRKGRDVCEGVATEPMPPVR